MISRTKVKRYITPNIFIELWEIQPTWLNIQGGFKKGLVERLQEGLALTYSWLLEWLYL